MKKKQQTFYEKELENGKISENNVTTYRLVNKNEINFDKFKKILYDNYTDNSIQLVIASSTINKIENGDKTLQQIINEYNDYVVKNFNAYYHQTIALNPEKSEEENQKLKSEMNKQCKDTLCHFIVDETMTNNKIYFVPNYDWTIF